MTRTKTRSFSAALVLMLLMVCILPFRANAAVADYLTFPEGDESITWVTPNSDNTTVELVLSVDTSADHTFTFTNKSSTKIQVGFSFDFSTYGGTSVTYVFSNNVATANNTASVTLEAGGSFSATISIVSDGNAEGVLNLTGINVSEVKETTVTVKYNELGTVSGYANGTQVTIPADGLSLTATANSGAKFLGWTDQNGKLLGDSATISISGTADLTEVHACFAKDSPWFLVKVSSGTTYLVEGLDKATAKVPTDTTYTATIVLMNDATLPAGSYTIPANATLLIPFDDAHTECIGEPLRSSATTTPSAYRTLKMASGANITVNGAISVAGTQSVTMGSNSAPVGKLGMIEMAGSSSITVESGGNLYVWGYIYRKGAGNEGTITIKSGGTVYECFQIMDWRGGTYTSAMIASGALIYEVFPISQYYIQNVQIPMTLQSGATEKIAVAFEASGSQVTNMSAFIGNSDGMFRIGSGGSITKDYEEETDRLNISATGAITMANIVISMYDLDIDSANFVLPLNGNISITLEDGCTVSQTQDFSLLPGAVVHIKKGASLTVESGTELVVYDNDNWGNYCYEPNVGNQRYVPLKYAVGDGGTASTNIRKSAPTADGKIIVEGELTATAGELYTTTGGASITGGNDAVGKVTFTSRQCATWRLGSGHKVYQTTQNSVDKFITDVDFRQVYSAYLQHGDGSYVTNATTKNTTYTYTYAHNVWATDHNVTSRVVAPTCTAEGYTEFTCSTHNVTWQSDTKVAALGHNMVAGTAVAPTCTTEGYTPYSCSRGDLTENRNPVPAKGHDYVPGEYTWTGTTACTVTGVCANDNSHTATANATITSEVTKKADCVNKGETTYTATFTEKWAKTQTKAVYDIEALGHTEETIPAVAATCTSTGLTVGKKCSVCNKVLVAQEEIAVLGHDWGTPTYEWSTDYATCTAKRVCKNDGSHTESETVTVSSVTVDPTYTEAGSITYTADFTKDWATDQTKTETLHAKVAAAQIDNTKYETLAEALAAVIEGDTIVLLVDKGENVVFDKCITLDTSAVSGYEIKCAEGYEAVDKGDGIYLIHNTTLFDLLGSSLKAGDSLDLYFYVSTDNVPIADKGNYTAVITRYRQGVLDTDTITIPGEEWQESSGMLRFCYDGITGKEMTDKVFVGIYKDDTLVSNVRMETVANYAYRILTKTVKDAEAGTKNAALRTTLVDMLNYGAGCQQIFDNYNGDLLANAAIDDYQKYATPSVSYNNDMNGDLNYFAGSTVSARNKLMYTFYFNFDPTGYTAEISYKNHYGTPVNATITTFRKNGNNYGVDVTGLAVADGRQTITCVLKDSNGAVTTTATGSVEDYVASAMASSSDDKTVFENLLKFVDSAYAYFHFEET